MSTIVLMKIVADTSTFLAVALNEPEKAEIIGITTGFELVAPDVLPFEFGNALSAMLKRKKLYSENIISVWDVIQAIPVELRSTNIRKALKIVAQHKIYAYDAYFIECAMNLRCPLLTLDRGMEKVAQEVGVKTLEVAL